MKMTMQALVSQMTKKYFLTGLLLFTGLACVTVHVTFPESAVQKATDDYVRELYRAKEKGRPSTPEPSPSLAPMHADLQFTLFTSAHAEELVFKVDSEKALKIRDRLSKRLDDVLAQIRAGVLGEARDGMLQLKEPGKLKKLFTKKIETLVAEENKDRADLYAEVLSSNALPAARLIDIQRSFARSFQAESPSGTWLQGADGTWLQKP